MIVRSADFCDARSNLGLIHLVHSDETMGHLLHRHLFRHDLMHRRVGLVPLDQRVDDTVERRREQQGLMGGLDIAQNPLDLGKNPMSAIRSASSTTTWATAATEIAFRSIRSIIRPGVATTRSTPSSSFSICFSIGAPP